MKIRSVVWYSMVIILLAALTALAWYYWTEAGGSLLLPVLVSLLSLSLTLWAGFRTPFRAQTDIRAVQRHQQLLAMRTEWRTHIRRLRRRGLIPRVYPYHVSHFWLVCDEPGLAAACLRQHGFTLLTDDADHTAAPDSGELSCWLAGQKVIWVSRAALLNGHSGQESARQLCRIRARQPLNGMILLHSAVSAAALSAEQATQRGQQHHAALIAFATRLGCRPPVHLMITGLSEPAPLRRYFADPARAQLFRVTDFRRERRELPDAPFSCFAAQIITDLQAGQLTGLSAGEPQLNAVILNFPAQLQAHLALWEHYVAALLHHPLAGTRLVLASAALSAVTSAATHVATPAFEHITYSADEVIRTDNERRYRLGYSLAACLCLSVLCGAGWYQWQQWAREQASLTQWRQVMALLKEDPESDHIQRLHNLQPLVAAVRESYDRWWWFGAPDLTLYHDYQQQVRRALFPVLAAQQAQHLKAALASASPQLLRETDDYQRLFSDDYDARQTAPVTIGDAETALLADYPVQPLSLQERALYDAALVSDATQQLAAAGPAPVLYDYLRGQFSAAQPVPSVPLNTLFGSDLSLLFRPEPRYQQVPAGMTRAGYLRWQAQWEDPAFQERFVQLWQTWFPGSQMALSVVTEQINQQYDEEYIRYWQGFLAALTLRPAAGADALMAQLRLPGQAYRDPVLAVLRGINANTLFTTARNRVTPDLNTAQQTAAQLGLSKISSRLKKAGRWQAAFARKPGHDEPAGRAISLAFADYHALLTPEGIPSPSLLAWQQAADALYLRWQQGLNDPDPLHYFYQALSAGSIVANRAPQTHPDVPVALTGWLQQWREASALLETEMAGYWLDRQWQQTVWPFWRDRIAKYYPFSQNAQSVDLRDLHRFFAADGLLASFIAQLPPDWQQAGENDRVQQPFARLPVLLRQTAQLRELFYAGGQDALNMRIALQPVSLTASLSGFRLTEGSESLLYQQGPQVWHVLRWPSAEDTAPLTTEYYSKGKVVWSGSVPGDWGLLRWLMSADAQGAAESPEMAVRENGYAFRFRYRINDKPFPLLPVLFSEYQLPHSLLAAAPAAQDNAQK